MSIYIVTWEGQPELGSEIMFVSASEVPKQFVIDTFPKQDHGGYVLRRYDADKILDEYACNAKRYGEDWGSYELVWAVKAYGDEWGSDCIKWYH